MTNDKEEKQKAPLAEILIATAVKIGQENNMTLVELIGHFDIAKLEVYNRNVMAAQRALEENRRVELAEGDDTEKSVAFSLDANEDKGEN